jgi:hypothetical protein
MEESVLLKTPVQFCQLLELWVNIRCCTCGRGRNGPYMSSLSDNFLKTSQLLEAWTKPFCAACGRGENALEKTTIEEPANEPDLVRRSKLMIRAQTPFVLTPRKLYEFLRNWLVSFCMACERGLQTGDGKSCISFQLVAEAWTGDHCPACGRGGQKSQQPPTKSISLYQQKEDDALQDQIAKRCKTIDSLMPLEELMLQIQQVVAPPVKKPSGLLQQFLDKHPQALKIAHS